MKDLHILIFLTLLGIMIIVSTSKILDSLDNIYTEVKSDHEIKVLTKSVIDKVMEKEDAKWRAK